MKQTIKTIVNKIVDFFSKKRKILKNKRKIIKGKLFSILGIDN
jgi:hypothetical protein